MKMKTFVLLLRGVNVGGRNSLPMSELLLVLDELGCRNAKTYIQSGNAVLESNKPASTLATEIGAAIRKRRGFAPHVLLLELKELERAIAANPFPEAETDPKALHVGFLDSEPSKPDLDQLSALAAKSERFQLIGRFFFLHAPDGAGKSKLAARSEKLLRVPMTDRNWRTVMTLREMAKQLA